MLRLFIFILILPTLLLSAEGDLDVLFGSAGKVITDVGGSDIANSVAIQSDGKILTVGSSDNGNDWDFALVRYNTDGTLDTTFNSNGIVTTDLLGSDDSARSIAIQSDGKIVVGGSSRQGTNTYFALVRYDINGDLDTSFHFDGKAFIYMGGSIYGISGVAIQNNGKIVVAGDGNSGSNYDFALVRYNTDGTLDTNFGTSGIVFTDVTGSHDYAYGVTIQSDGKIIAAGSGFALVRYLIDGNLDTSFGTGGIVITNMDGSHETANSVVIQSNGKIIAAGYSSNGSHDKFTLVRYGTNGDLDTTFNNDGIVTTDVGDSYSLAHSAVIQSDGKIIAAGYAYSGNNQDFALVRYNSNGSLDTTFNGDGKVITGVGSLDDGAKSVAIQSDGKIITAGGSGDCGSSDFALVRYQGTPISLAPIYYLLQ